MSTATSWAGSDTMGYANLESLLDDVSRQMASSNITKHSRGSTGQRLGGSMRIIKPNSTSNSPRSSIGLARRRTVMDGFTRRKAPLVEQNVGISAGNGFQDGVGIPAKSSRPVSWHPSSHLAPQTFYYSAPFVPTNSDYQNYDLVQTSAVYSGYTSPASTFSPISNPFTGYEQQTFPYSDLTTAYPSGYTMNPAPGFTSQSHYSDSVVENIEPSLSSHFDWNHFANNGFDNSSTNPPTPENFLPIQHPEPAFPAEESIPYHSLSDTEVGGDEVLVGMGLYDLPELSKISSSDPHLDNYRALKMSRLLGPAYRQAEPTGKGLKLEETWNPPSSDGEKEEDDDEQDGEGDDDDEEALPDAEVPEVIIHTQVNHAPPQASMSHSNYLDIGTFLPHAMQTNFRPQYYDRNGWL